MTAVVALTATLLLCLQCRQITAHSIASSWQCPTVDSIHDISCLCDLPHTLRCRGSSSGPNTLVNLKSSLQESQVSLLDLAIHNLTSLPDAAFDGLELLGLVVSSASLTKLNEGTFRGIKSTLAALSLTSNEFSEVPYSALSLLLKLQTLDLSDNSIEKLPTQAFPTLIQLLTLSLAGNNLRTIAPEAFVKIPHLVSLNLARNQLDASEINERTLWGLHFLKELSLQNNLLKGKLSPDFITGATTVTKLDFSYNAITSISLGALQSYTQLRVLDLSHNKIDVIEDHALLHLQQLHELILSHNNIIGVSGASFSHVPLLHTLALADNAIITVSADLLHELSGLKSLNLAANDIETFQPHVFNSTPALQHINLDDNPLQCDCALLWLQSWLKSHQTLTEKDKSSFVCFTPWTLQNTPLIELETSQLHCGSNASRYHDTLYHEDDELYSDYHRDDPDLSMSDSHVGLKVARWTSSGLQLEWEVDKQALPYECQAVFVYEVQHLQSGPHQILTEKVERNCSSQSMSNPERLSVVLPENSLVVGTTYRYCLLLLEHQPGNDEEEILPGCTEPMLLTAPSLNDSMHQVTSLTGGAQQGALVVHTRLSYIGSCTYSIVIVHERSVVGTKQLNCSQPRYSFHDIPTGMYTACVYPDSTAYSLKHLKHNLKVAENYTAVLHATFPACTPLMEYQKLGWTSDPLFFLVFTIPGLALILTLYIIGRKVWKGGGVPWRWDPRASKTAKYFLYTGDSVSPTASLDPLPAPLPETTTNV